VLLCSAPMTVLSRRERERLAEEDDQNAHCYKPTLPEYV
jgi:hypothetical protein